MSKAIEDVTAERLRQIEGEGFDAVHDDTNPNEFLLRAAMCYCRSAYTGETGRRALWPWAPSWWKPKDKRADMVRAAALIIAAIDHHDREVENQ